MGVDLTLLPVSHVTDEGDMICLHAFDLDLSDVIAPFWEMKRGRHHGRIFWPIEKASDDAAPWSAAPYIGGQLQNSRFGWATESASFVLAGDVQQTFAALVDLLADANDFERAAIAYVSALEPSTKVFVVSW
jgi:hypothetical protein